MDILGKANQGKLYIVRMTRDEYLLRQTLQKDIRAMQDKLTDLTWRVGQLPDDMVEKQVPPAVKSNWRGPWANMKSYEPDDLVEYHGSLYMCKKSVSHVYWPPDNNTSDWYLVGQVHPRLGGEWG